MQNKNKPLLLRPSGKDYLWGGNRLNDEFEKNIDMDPLAETWECSTHPDGPSYVVSGEFGGQELAEVLRAHSGVSGRTAQRRKYSAHPHQIHRRQERFVHSGPSYRRVCAGK